MISHLVKIIKGQNDAFARLKNRWVRIWIYANAEENKQKVPSLNPNSPIKMARLSSFFLIWRVFFIAKTDTTTRKSTKILFILDYRFCSRVRIYYFTRISPFLFEKNRKQEKKMFYIIFNTPITIQFCLSVHNCHQKQTQIILQLLIYNMQHPE